MNYEQKYKEALGRAKKFYNNEGCRVGMTPVDLEVIFPELKESEDERVRKQIISFLKEFEYDHYRCLDFSSWIAWLEKQREQKPINNIEPKKFKVGDWITDGYLHYKITDVLEDRYIVDTKIVKRNAILFNHENRYHLWTIEDARDGDVLKEDSCIFIVEKINPNGTAIVHCCLFDDGEFDSIGSTLGFDVDSTKPATKEQRDLLFAKMHEAGYEWDEEMKELKKQ